MFTSIHMPHTHTHTHTLTHTHTRLTALFPGLPGWAGTRKVKPIWILLEQETMSGSGISLAICKSAPRSRQITTPAPLHSVFTGRMPFLPPNQQRQSTEGKAFICQWTALSMAVWRPRPHSSYLWANVDNMERCCLTATNTYSLPLFATGCAVALVSIRNGSLVTSRCGVFH